ncbi:MAG: undecaprenyl diphosphate synthase [Sphingobacteriales bacterium]|jgi:undecaprenyl diphosphate synthase
MSSMELSIEALKEQIDLKKVPNHVAIIMDGNGRWAKQQNEDRIFGHLNGVNSVRESLVAARELGVQFLTLYAFSSENWNRPKEEVQALMGLLVQTIFKEVDELMDKGIRLRTIGNINDLPEDCKDALNQAVEKTKNNTEVTLTLALSYGGRWEILEATKKWIEDCKKDPSLLDKLTEKSFSEALPSGWLPDPDLMIRTSGEQRISNFLLWQSAYTEFIFSPVMWPDFDKTQFYNSIFQYQNRERRFGKTSEQIHS